MNGLLLRLAEQARGRVSPIHSVVRLPFAAAPVLQVQEMPTSVAAEDMPDSQSRRHGQRLEWPTSGRSLPAGPMPHRERALGAALGEIPAALLEPTVERHDARLDVRPVEISPPGQNQLIPIIDPLRGHDVDYQGIEAAAPGKHESVAASISPAHEGLENAPFAPHLLVRQRFARRQLFAEPLLPLQPNGYFHAQYGRITAPVIQERLESSRPTEDSVEVHVSIGRIEVTAVQEAPRARREPVATSKPMSLDEYLAKRGGGS